MLSPGSVQNSSFFSECGKETENATKVRSNPNPKKKTLTTYTIFIFLNC